MSVSSSSKKSSTIETIEREPVWLPTLSAPLGGKQVMFLQECKQYGGLFALAAHNDVFGYRKMAFSALARNVVEGLLELHIATDYMLPIMRLLVRSRRGTNLRARINSIDVVFDDAGKSGLFYDGRFEHRRERDVQRLLKAVNAWAPGPESLVDVDMRYRHGMI